MRNIYKSHDDWGEDTYAFAPEMEAIIADLRALGDDWEDCDIDDCDEFEPVRELPDGEGSVYRRIGTRSPDFPIFHISGTDISLIGYADVSPDTSKV